MPRQRNEETQEQPRQLQINSELSLILEELDGMIKGYGSKDATAKLNEIIAGINGALRTEDDEIAARQVMEKTRETIQARLDTASKSTSSVLQQKVGESKVKIRILKSTIDRIDKRQEVIDALIQRGESKDELLGIQEEKASFNREKLKDIRSKEQEAAKRRLTMEEQSGKVENIKKAELLKTDLKSAISEYKKLKNPTNNADKERKQELVERISGYIKSLKDCGLDTKDVEGWKTDSSKLDAFSNSQDAKIKDMKKALYNSFIGLDPAITAEFTAEANALATDEQKADLLMEKMNELSNKAVKAHQELAKKRATLEKEKEEIENSKKWLSERGQVTQEPVVDKSTMTKKEIKAYEKAQRKERGDTKKDLKKLDMQYALDPETCDYLRDDDGNLVERKGIFKKYRAKRDWYKATGKGGWFKAIFGRAYYKDLNDRTQYELTEGKAQRAEKQVKASDRSEWAQSLKAVSRENMGKDLTSEELSRMASERMIKQAGRSQNNEGR